MAKYSALDLRTAPKPLKTFADNSEKIYFTLPFLVDEIFQEIPIVLQNIKCYYFSVSLNPDFSKKFPPEEEPDILKKIRHCRNNHTELLELDLSVVQMSIRIYEADQYSRMAGRFLGFCLPEEPDDFKKKNF
jgi:hypothetical protein